MSPITFFRGSLVLPLLLPLVLLPFAGLNIVAGLLFISLAFGGIQYLVFAVLMFVQIGRLGTSARIRRLSYWTPPLFVPLQALGWILYEIFDQWRNPEGTWELGVLLPFTFYSLAVGYAYVALVNVGFLLARRAGWVAD